MLKLWFVVVIVQFVKESRFSVVKYVQYIYIFFSTTVDQISNTALFIFVVVEMNHHTFKMAGDDMIKEETTQNSEIILSGHVSDLNLYFVFISTDRRATTNNFGYLSSITEILVYLARFFCVFKLNFLLEYALI